MAHFGSLISERLCSSATLIHHRLYSKNKKRRTRILRYRIKYLLRNNWCKLLWFYTYNLLKSKKTDENITVLYTLFYSHKIHTFQYFEYPPHLLAIFQINQSYDVVTKNSKNTRKYLLRGCILGVMTDTTPLLIWIESTINRWYFECTSI